MVHKPKHKVHSFRGLLGDGGQDEINLERSNVNLAYRIVKFQIIEQSPLDTTARWCVKIFREQQTASTTSIDFTDQDLLGAGIWTGQASAHNYPEDMVIIFDNVLFSRNIYVTAKYETGTNCNYLIELEEVPVGPATLMQLKLGVARKLNLKQ